MIFTLQFEWFRRGVPEVIGERRCEALEETAAIARVRSLVGPSDWPSGAQAVRILDDSGRKVSDWRIGDDGADSDEVGRAFRWDVGHAFRSMSATCSD
jgi:hypothetical protein